MEFDYRALTDEAASSLFGFLLHPYWRESEAQLTKKQAVLLMDDIYKEVWNKNISVNPANLHHSSSSTMDAIQRVKEETLVKLGYTTHMSYVLKQAEVCNVTLSSERFFKSNFAFTSSKDFPYIDMFNEK